MSSPSKKSDSYLIISLACLAVGVFLGNSLSPKRDMARTLKEIQLSQDEFLRHEAVTSSRVHQALSASANNSNKITDLQTIVKRHDDQLKLLLENKDE